MTMSITRVVKVINRVLMAIVIISVALIAVLGVIGGGWGEKTFLKDHPFYSGDLRLISHRGVTDQAPENTFSAAARARDLNFDGLEIDVKKSKDHKFYLFHDRSSQRLFGKDFNIKEKTLADLQSFPLLHEGTKTQHRVPELNAFIDEFSNDFSLYLDIKRHGNNRYQQLTTQVNNFLQHHNILNNSFVGSDFLFTAYLEFRFPEIHTVFTGPGDRSAIVYRLIPKKFRPDFIISYADEVTESHLAWLKKTGLINRRMLYGVNETNYQRVKKWGVPILVVDYHPIMKKDL